MDVVCRDTYQESRDSPKPCETSKGCVPLVPPQKAIPDILCVSEKIAIKFIMELR
jgi:hypothetical protein